MVEISRKDIKYFYELNFKVYVYENEELLICGTKADTNLTPYFNQGLKYKFYLKKSRTNRFLKYLAGQVLVGYCLMASFGLLSLSFGLLTITNITEPQGWLILPFFVGTAGVSYWGRRIAVQARKRITKSLNKKIKS